MSMLHELTEQLGPPDEGMVAEAMEELTALVHRMWRVATDR
jgi:hypothetical protein